MIIKAYSKAKYSTWILYSPLSTLFDAGEGINCLLEEKLVTISNILLSHGHTDHYTGLINILMTKLAHFNNSGVAFPTKVFYPKNDFTLKKYIEYIIESYKIENSPISIEFIPVEDGKRYELNKSKKTFVEVFKMEHTKDVSAVGYKIYETRTKLKEEYITLPQKEIQKLIFEKGKDSVTYEKDKPILVYSGDGKLISKNIVEDCEILFHESTFLKSEDRKGQLHSTMEEVIDLASKINLKKLYLYHFSSRYTGEQINRKIKEVRNRIPNTEISFITPGKLFIVD